MLRGAQCKWLCVLRMIEIYQLESVFSQISPPCYKNHSHRHHCRPPPRCARVKRPHCCHIIARLQLAGSTSTCIMFVLIC